MKRYLKLIMLGMTLVYFSSGVISTLTVRKLPELVILITVLFIASILGLTLIAFGVKILERESQKCSN